MKERNLGNLRGHERFTFIEADLLDLDLAAPDGATYVQCLDPEQMTRGGTVTFRIVIE